MIVQEKISLILAKPRKTALISFFFNSGEFHMYIKVEMIVDSDPSCAYHPISVIIYREPIVFLNCYGLIFIAVLQGNDSALKWLYLLGLNGPFCQSR